MSNLIAQMLQRDADELMAACPKGADLAIERFYADQEQSARRQAALDLAVRRETSPHWRLVVGKMPGPRLYLLDNPTGPDRIRAEFKRIMEAE